MTEHVHTSQPLEESIVNGLTTLSLSLPNDRVELLARFIRLLTKWNRVYNLTAVREIDKMVSLHLLDSLVAVPYIKGNRIIDVGTGPGLPGVPLSIACPQWQFVLLDSNRKKTRFVSQAVIELGLENVEIVTARVEDFQPLTRFSTVIARAFASIPNMLKLTGHLCAPSGNFVFMKGVFPSEELAGLPGGYALESVFRVSVPGMSLERHLVVVAPTSLAQ